MQNELAAIEMEICRRLSDQPILGYMPHRGQMLYHLARAPLEILTTGNRFGKSTGGGAEGSQAIQLVHEVEDKYRKSTADNPFRWRYISEPEVLKGVVQPFIMSLFPAGAVQTGRKDQTGFFEEFFIHGFNPSGVEYWATIEFKNNGSPVSTFAGTWFDLITIDEPCGEAVYNENRARLSASDYPLRIHILWTALDDANWADTVIYDSPDYNDPAKIFHYEGSTWDNCRCLTPEEHGLECRCHGGHIPKAKIVEFENEIKRTDPLEYEARVLGKRKGGSRVVFPILNREVHLFKLSDMKDWVKGRPKLCTIYVSVDPHGGRPDFVKFWVIEPNGFQWQVAEWPSFVNGRFAGMYYEKIRGNQTSYDDLAKIVIETCKSLGWPDITIGGMAIDPHYASQTPKGAELVDGRLETVVEGINRAIRKRQADFPRFMLAKVTKDNGGEIDAGLRDLNEQYWYDANKPVGKGNEPMMRYSDTCVNSYRCAQSFKRSKPSSVEGASLVNSRFEEEFKHGVDVDRYYRAMQPHYSRPFSEQEYRRSQLLNQPPSSRVA